VQRLFSTFANGWPGIGLLLQRVLTAVLLLRIEVFELDRGAPLSSMIPQFIACVAGIFLLVGLWTPVIGALIALIELWFIINGSVHPWRSVTLMTLSASAAMTGPGAWSLDARIFGRKRLST
jgi:putative oxidoreductase